MSAYPERLSIAMQKSGRLADRSLELMRAADLSVLKGANDLLYRVENQPIDLLRVRDDDIPTLVGGGVADLGVVGRNVLEEHEFSNDARDMHAAFGGVNYTVVTRDPQRDSGLFTAGVDFVFGPRALLYADVTAQTGGKIKLLSAWRVGLSVRF